MSHLNDCSGCTDDRSEGTHQMHTKQHPCREGGDPNCGYCFPQPSVESWCCGRCVGVQFERDEKATKSLGHAVGDMKEICVEKSCPCHQESRACCATSPNCSHNTNGRDLDKPCSIEVKPSLPPSSIGWRERFDEVFPWFKIASYGRGKPDEEKLKSFIAQEIQMAEERGFKKGHQEGLNTTFRSQKGKYVYAKPV